MKIRTLLLALATLAVASPAAAALNAYLEIQGATQGTFVGSSTLAGREGQLETFEFHHLVERDASGLVHQSFIVTIELSDSAIPELVRAMATNETLQIVVNLWEPNQVGQEINYMDIDLVNAKVVSIEPLQALNLIPENMALPATARIRFDYTSIVFEDLIDNDPATLNNP